MWSCEVRYVSGSRVYCVGSKDEVRLFVKKMMKRKCEVFVFVEGICWFNFYECGVVVGDELVVWGVWEKKNVGVIKEYVVDRVKLGVNEYMGVGVKKWKEVEVLCEKYWMKGGDV